MTAPDPLILITNDDGIDAPGLRALESALAPLGRLRTVAPLMEQSAASRRITLRRPLRYERKGEGRFGVDGTPADSVMMALTLLVQETPALVVAGINAGPNLGENIYYSGTVAGAAEGSKYGIPALAVSVNQRSSIDFGPSARIAAALAKNVLAEGLPKGIALNVNVPAGEAAGVAVTHQCRKISRNLMIEARDPHDRKYYWMHEEVPRRSRLGWQRLRCGASGPGIRHAATLRPHGARAHRRPAAGPARVRPAGSLKRPLRWRIQASKGLTALPWTSVSRNLRPWNLNVSLVWSTPSRCSIVACRSCTETGFSLML